MGPEHASPVCSPMPVRGYDDAAHAHVGASVVSSYARLDAARATPCVRVAACPPAAVLARWTTPQSLSPPSRAVLLSCRISYLILTAQDKVLRILGGALFADAVPLTIPDA